MDNASILAARLGLGEMVKGEANEAMKLFDFAGNGYSEHLLIDLALSRITSSQNSLLPQAIACPAILLEALMANAIALGQGAGNILLDNDAYQMLLHRAIEKFGPKSTSLPLQDCEGIDQVGKSCLILFCSFSHRLSSRTTSLVQSAAITKLVARELKLFVNSLVAKIPYCRPQSC